MIAQHSRTAELQPLYAGEKLQRIAGFPTVYHYQPASDSSPEAPLIVCVTGGLHLARVFYGGHDGHNPKDFLAYWLADRGFNVLSLSYPLETDPPVMPLTGAAFRIPDWGTQAAETARIIIDRHGLARSVVLISWSMGGRMVVPFNICAKERGITVQQYISFAATPGISSIRPLPAGIECTPAGYFHVPPHVNAFRTQLEAMEEYTGHEVIPKQIYLDQYIGATPVNLIGLGLKYDGESAFVQDEVRHEEDSQVFNVPNLPLISAIYPTSILDASHALADKATWGFLLTYGLEARIGKLALASVQGTPKWQALMDIVHEAPGRLAVPSGGNHFFFVGENGARQTAGQVQRLLEEGKLITTELDNLLS